MVEKQQKVTNWSANQRDFQLWLALPSEYRGDIRTEGDFAKKAGIHRTTLWDWKKIPGFWGEVQELSKQYLADAVPETLRTLKDMSRRGSFQHQKLFLEMVGMYTPTQQLTGKDGTPLMPVKEIVEIVRVADDGTDTTVDD